MKREKKKWMIGFAYGSKLGPSVPYAETPVPEAKAKTKGPILTQATLERAERAVEIRKTSFRRVGHAT